MSFPDSPKKETLVRLAADQILALKGKTYEITGLSGRAWLTDGVGGERVIDPGQQITVRSKGKICIQAFKPATVRVLSRNRSARWISRILQRRENPPRPAGCAGENALAGEARPSF